MANVCYGLAGLSQEPASLDQVAGWTEVFMYNPTHSPNEVRVTAYFEEKDPFSFPDVYQIAPQTSALFVMPEVAPVAFDNTGFCGLRFESTRHLDPIMIQLNGSQATLTELPAFKGGCSHLLGVGLASEWHFADGLWLDWKRFYQGDLSKAPFPFNQLENYFFLNPGSAEARVELILQYRNIERDTVHLTVAPGRCLAWCNYEKVPYNQPYAVKIVSSDPIAASSARYVYGLNGPGEWGINLHCGMPGQPGPYTAWQSMRER